MNKTIIYDRYFYDFLVSFEYLRVPGFRLFAKFIPTVKNKFFLSCPPELCYIRKPENSKEFFEQCHKMYIQMAQEYSIKILENYNKKPEETLSSVVSQVMP